MPEIQGAEPLVFITSSPRWLKISQIKCRSLCSFVLEVLPLPPIQNKFLHAVRSVYTIPLPDDCLCITFKYERLSQSPIKPFPSHFTLSCAKHLLLFGPPELMSFTLHHGEVQVSNEDPDSFFLCASRGTWVYSSVSHARASGEDEEATTAGLHYPPSMATTFF